MFSYNDSQLLAPSTPEKMRSSGNQMLSTLMKKTKTKKPRIRNASYLYCHLTAEQKNNHYIYLDTFELVMKAQVDNKRPHLGVWQFFQRDFCYEGTCRLIERPELKKIEIKNGQPTINGKVVCFAKKYQRNSARRKNKSTVTSSISSTLTPSIAAPMIPTESATVTSSSVATSSSATSADKLFEFPFIEPTNQFTYRPGASVFFQPPNDTAIPDSSFSISDFLNPDY